MPTYTAHCAVCDSHIDFVRKVEQRDDTPTHCNKPTSRILAAPMIPAMGLVDHYVVRGGDGKDYYGAGAYKKYLKDNDLVPQSELKGEAQYQKKEAEKKRRTEIRKDVIDAARHIE